MKTKYSYPLIRFRPRRDGKFKTSKIYCFIRYGGSLATRFSTSIECIYNYNTKKQEFTGASEEVNVLNQQIARIRTDIRKAYEKLLDINAPISAQSLRDYYLNAAKRNTIETPTVLNLIKAYIMHRQKTESLEMGTIEKMNIAHDKFKDYIALKANRKDMDLLSITAEHGRKFHEFLLSQKNNQGNIISKEHAFRMFRTLFNAIEYGIKQGFLLENPLKIVEVKRPKERIKINPLTETDVMKIYNCEGVTSTEKKVIDGFVLICFTGFRHSDYLQFLSDPKRYIFTDETGFSYIELYSYKNRKDDEQESSFVPLMPIVEEILQRYNYKLPSYSDQIINRYLKRIASRCEILKADKITTYTARKTCACIFGNMDGVEVKSVSKILGHKKVSTTEKYYFRVSTDTVKRQFLNANKYF